MTPNPTDDPGANPTAAAMVDALKALADPTRAKNSEWFFKTGPGEYGHGDTFLGVSVPNTRSLTKRAAALSSVEIGLLAHSEFHEARLLAAIAMVRQYELAERAHDTAEQERLFNQWVQLLGQNCWNNWDIIDSSAHKLAGKWLLSRDRSVLFHWVQSPDVWHRRAALLTTFWFIYEGDASTSLQLAAMVLDDKHDLIHKAAGWMLREVGKRVSPNLLHDFLTVHVKQMPRTMLRYAIEHIPEPQRKAWLAA